MAGGMIEIDVEKLSPIADSVRTAWHALEAASTYATLQAGDVHGSLSGKVEDFTSCNGEVREQLVKSLESASKLLDAAVSMFSQTESELVKCLTGGSR